jgi:flagellar biosynthesis/type III secretory pathway chaperone
METREILDKLEELLEEERMAIRTLKGSRVHSIACEKLELMQQLDARREAGWKEFAPRVKEVVRRLRHNSVLLVHAKSILAEALRVKKARFASSSRVAIPFAGKPEGVRFSVVG